MKAFRKVKISERETSLFQDAVAAILGPLSKNPYIDGLLVPNVVLVIGTNTVIHKLGRAPQGWVITDIDSASTIFKVTMDSQSLVLDASADVTISLWVY